MFSPQYIQLTLKLPSDIVYGLGEHNHKRFRHDMNWKKWTIFTRDEAPVVSVLCIATKGTSVNHFVR